jgi:hypothetical protein
MKTITLTPVDGTVLPVDLDGAVAGLFTQPDGTVQAEIRIPGPSVDMGRTAYEAYVASCGGRSVRGEPLPSWPRQQPEIREHWRAAADAVLMLADLCAAPPG